jgi:hypothetical protein
MQSLLVKPVGTEDLLRQIEALLVLREDARHENERLLPQPSRTPERHPAPLNKEGRRKTS